MNWKQEYRAAMLNYVLRNGTVLAQYADTSSSETYADYRNGPAIREHLLCDDAKLEKLEESTWWAGNDTFNTGEETHGVDLIVSCACGEVEHQCIRYEGTVSEILMGILNEED